MAGCQTTEPKFPDIVGKQAETNHLEAILLREGDVLKSRFRRSRAQFNPADPEGRQYVLVLIGEVKAVGMTPSDLQKELVKRAATAGVLPRKSPSRCNPLHFRCS